MSKCRRYFDELKWNTLILCNVNILRLFLLPPCQTKYFCVWQAPGLTAVKSVHFYSTNNIFCKLSWLRCRLLKIINKALVIFYSNFNNSQKFLYVSLYFNKRILLFLNLESFGGLMVKISQASQFSQLSVLTLKGKWLRCYWVSFQTVSISVVELLVFPAVFSREWAASGWKAKQWMM